MTHPILKVQDLSLLDVKEISLTKAMLLAAIRNTMNHSKYLCSTKHLTLWRTHVQITSHVVSSNLVQQPGWVGKQSSTSYSRMFREQQHTRLGESPGLAIRESFLDAVPLVTREALLDAVPPVSAWPLLTEKKSNSTITQVNAVVRNSLVLVFVLSISPFALYYRKTPRLTTPLCIVTSDPHARCWSILCICWNVSFL